MDRTLRLSDAPFARLETSSPVRRSERRIDVKIRVQYDSVAVTISGQHEW
jgi:hypothetical protein